MELPPFGKRGSEELRSELSLKPLSWAGGPFLVLLLQHGCNLIKWLSGKKLPDVLLTSSMIIYKKH